MYAHQQGSVHDICSDLYVGHISSLMFHDIRDFNGLVLKGCSFVLVVILSLSHGWVSIATLCGSLAQWNVLHGLVSLRKNSEFRHTVDVSKSNFSETRLNCEKKWYKSHFWNWILICLDLQILQIAQVLAKLWSWSKRRVSNISLWQGSLARVALTNVVSIHKRFGCYLEPWSHSI